MIMPGLFYQIKSIRCQTCAAKVARSRRAWQTNLSPVSDRFRRGLPCSCFYMGFLSAVGDSPSSRIEHAQKKGGAWLPGNETNTGSNRRRAPAHGQQPQQGHHPDDKQRFGNPGCRACCCGKAKRTADDGDNQKCNCPSKHGVPLSAWINARWRSLSIAGDVPGNNSLLNQAASLPGDGQTIPGKAQASSAPDIQPVSSRSLNRAGVRPWRSSSRYTSVRLRPASRATSLTWPRVSFSSVMR